MKRRLRTWVKVSAVLAGLLALSPRKGQEPVQPQMPEPPASAAPIETQQASDKEPESLSEWRKINEDVEYVLTFSDGNENRIIPVVAVSDASYALSHDIKGKKDTMGSVFCDQSPAAPENLVIYGHSSLTKDRCFTFLKNYMNPAYYRAHPMVSVEDESGIRMCRIVSAAVYELDQDVFVGWADNTLSGSDEINDMFQSSIPYLVNHTDGEVYEGGGVLTLVTCDMTKKDARIVLQALCTT